MDLLHIPSLLIDTILAAWFISSFVFASREAAIQLLLRQTGVVGDAQITEKKRGYGRGGPIYWITYEFVEFTTGKKYRREEFISRKHYRQWSIGEIVPTFVLPYKPRISRLAGDKRRTLTYFTGAAFTLIFPIFFFGVGAMLAAFSICIATFCVNLLWISLRRE